MRRVFTSTRALAAVAVIAVMALAAACGGADDARDSADGGALLGTTGGASRERIDEYRGPDTDDSASGEAPAPVAGGQSTGGGAVLPQLLDRKLIRTAVVHVQTEDVAGTFESIRALAVTAQGVVSHSSFGRDGEFETATITIRVPGDQYEDVLAQLRGLGDVRKEDSDASDVTEEYTDLQSRARNLQATEAQYLTLLQRAETINDILVVQDRLNVVRSEIEQVQGRIQLLSNQTELATITAYLAPPALQPKTDGDGGAGNPLEVAEEAFAASLDVLEGIATVGLAVVAFSWWLLPLAAAGAWLGRRQMRIDRERRQSPPAAPSA